MFFKSVPTVSWKDITARDTIIDVREPYEFAQKHAPKAKNVPLGKIDAYTTAHTVYVVCASGSRSKRAVKMLRKRGIDAINIRGGMLTYGK